MMKDIDICLKPEEEIESKEFTLSKDNIKYNIRVIKTKLKLILSCIHYEFKSNIEELITISKLFNICKSIEEVYEFIINLFNKQKVFIKEIIPNKTLKLFFVIYNNIKSTEEKTEIILYYNKYSKHIIIIEMYNKYNLLQSELNKLHEENKSIKEQLEKILEEISFFKKENTELKKEINNFKTLAQTPPPSPSPIPSQIPAPLKNSNKKISKSKSKSKTKSNEKENNNNNNSNKKKENKKVNLDIDISIETNDTENDLLNMYNSQTFRFKSNPSKIQYLTQLTDDSYSHWGIDNTFTTFTSLNNISYLVYATEEYSIHFYNLNEQKLVKVIENAHIEDQVTNFRHFVDKIKKRDILMSISADSRNVRLWDIKNWELLTNITKIYSTGYLYSASFLVDDGKYYIATCNSSQKSEKIKIFDFYGEYIKDISNSNEDTYFIDCYYDNKLNKYFILTGNISYVKSYDYKENKLYFKYADKGNKDGHDSIIVDNSKEVIKLIESSGDGFIRIWKFHTGELLNKIHIGKNELRGLCLWNNNYLFVGCTDNSIKLVELKNGIIIKSLTGLNNEVCTIKKIVHPTFGECIITQGWENDQIKLWVIKN